MSAYLPPDETVSMIGQDRANFAGALIEAGLYGILVILTGLCVNYLRADMQHHRTHSLIMLSFVVMFFTLGTLACIANSIMADRMFVEFRFPGGPSAYLDTFYSARVNVMNDAVFFLGGFLADGLLLYRAWMVWNNNYYVIAFPAFLWVGTFVVSMKDSWEIAQPGATLEKAMPAAFTTAYIAGTVSVNVILTGLIAGRLLYMSSRVTKNLGGQHAKTYTSIVSMTVESAFLYTSTAVAFLITFLLDSPAALAFCPIVSQTVFISPMLIIWRVSVGRAWSRSTVQNAYTGNDGSMTHSNSTTMEQLRFRTTKTGHGTDMYGSASEFTTKNDQELV